MNLCCIHCFKNEFIQAKIRTIAETGKCSYCNMGGRKKAWVASVGIVGDFIRKKLKLGYRNASTDDVPYYALSGIASSIEEVLIYDEDIFSEDMDLLDKTQSLIHDMFKSSGPSYRDIAQGETDEWEAGDAEVVKIDEFYVSEDENELLFGWEDFKYNVKHINRFFDVGSLKTREEMLRRFLPILKEMAVTLPAGTQIWRARIKPKGRVLKKNRHLECGPPPRNYAVPLRMNPHLAFLTFMERKI